MSFLIGLFFVVWAAAAVGSAYSPVVRDFIEARSPLRWMMVAPRAGWCALAVGVLIWLPPPLRVDIFIAVVGAALILGTSALRRRGAAER